MMASASVSGGVLFVPERIERQIPKMSKRLSNDNSDKTEEREA